MPVVQNFICDLQIYSW